MAFLHDVLGNGAVSAKALVAAAREAGIAERTLHRTKKRAQRVSYSHLVGVHMVTLGTKRIS